MNKKIALFTTLGLCTACVGSAFAISNIGKSFTKAEGNSYSVTFDKDSKFDGIYFHSTSVSGTDFVFKPLNFTGDSDECLTTLRENGAGFEILNEFENVESFIITYIGAEKLSIYFDDPKGSNYDTNRRSYATSGVECTPSDASYGKGCILRCWIASYTTEDVVIESITVNYTCGK